MNRTLRKRKQPNQPTLNTRSSAAAAASAAATVESPSISPVSKRVKIEKEEEVSLETVPAVVKSEAAEKNVSSPAEAKETTTANQKCKTPEPSSDEKIEKEAPAKPAEAAPKVVINAKEKEVEVIEEKKQPPPEEVIEVEDDVPAVDPYESLSEADRKLFFTDIVGFLKRFTPKYHVPVYRTWSISKSATK